MVFLLRQRLNSTGDVVLTLAHRHFLRIVFDNLAAQELRSLNFVIRNRSVMVFRAITVILLHLRAHMERLCIARGLLLPDEEQTLPFSLLEELGRIVTHMN